jgi:hypothetical protein
MSPFICDGCGKQEDAKTLPKGWVVTAHGHVKPLKFTRRIDIKKIRDLPPLTYKRWCEKCKGKPAATGLID